MRTYSSERAYLAFSGSEIPRCADFLQNVRSMYVHTSHEHIYTQPAAYLYLTVSSYDLYLYIIIKILPKSLPYYEYRRSPEITHTVQIIYYYTR